LGKSLFIHFLYNRGVTKSADLIGYLFEGRPHLLSGELSQWMEASSRITAFVETYRDKIRKKIRLASEEEKILDLRSELEVATSLLRDRRLAVAYEPYPSSKGRGPDFAVTYRVNTVFNIEVARMRMEENELNAIDLPRKEERFLRILLYKLGQMQPGMPNLLVIHTRQELARSLDLDRLMQEIKTRAEGKDSSFYEISRYVNPAAFYKDFLHLSAIVLGAGSHDMQVWVNKQARPAMAPEALRLVTSLLANANIA
jgi:hypothetical protein